MIAAVIGIGSNSVRMLLAEVSAGTVEMLQRDREGTRLFAGLDAQRRLSQEAMAKTAAAVRRMAEAARQAGAERLHLFATSATRDASNKAEFAALLKAEAGLELEICSGEEEAALSFYGATDGGESGVIDIGGGSTEVIVGSGMNVHCAFSCQMGAVRLAGRHPIRDHGDLPYVIRLAGDLLEEQLRAHPTLTLPASWRGTGGTFTTLAAIVRKVHWTERTHMHGTVVTLKDVEDTARMLSDMTVDQRRELPGLQPNRADIIVHGVCILLACMYRLGIKQITVSEYGNLDGYMKHAYLGK
ncbi:MAG: Ppx/GppA family phosphatase [Clostridia bacterium]|nr:Ppx/GppA family phosphatase [Clostridia bacterium]